jgi:hypothetical protein
MLRSGNEGNVRKRRFLALFVCSGGIPYLLGNRCKRVEWLGSFDLDRVTVFLSETKCLKGTELGRLEQSNAAKLTDDGLLVCPTDVPE